MSFMVRSIYSSKSIYMHHERAQSVIVFFPYLNSLGNVVALEIGDLDLVGLGGGRRKVEVDAPSIAARASLKVH